ncbi:dihydroorotate dehydrogenase [bacterium (Candidatus Torokbacteria) CG09_land_8_20_14_0_10_42_11]|nr:MAG: dihydroorotate dehydrogenase [bacterium (Candidatus Torokbacteria) CG09_land_8_20_14_0_10_42_11]
MNMEINIGGIKMKNPVMPASGIFGYAKEYDGLVELNRLGAIVTKSITVEPREGAPQPCLCETSSGLINCIRLQNPGIEIFLAQKMPFLKTLKPSIIVSIAGNTIKEYVKLAKILSQEEGIAGLEINISCPNTQEGGILFGQDPKIAFEVISAVRVSTSLPIITKLTPNVTDIVSIARAAVEGGTNVLSLINTLRARAKIRNGPHAGCWIQGGLSGPAIKPIALSMVKEVAQANLGVPIIGMGGIMCLEDALDFFEAGATAIAIGTATFANPKIMEEVILGLEKYLQGQGIKGTNEIVGAALK